MKSTKVRKVRPYWQRAIKSNTDLIWDLGVRVLALEEKMAQLPTPKKPEDKAAKPLKSAAISVPTQVWNATAKNFCEEHGIYQDHEGQPDNAKILAKLGEMRYKTITVKNISQAFSDLLDDFMGVKF